MAMIISCVKGWLSFESLFGALIQPVVSHGGDIG